MCNFSLLNWLVWNVNAIGMEWKLRFHLSTRIRSNAIWNRATNHWAKCEMRISFTHIVRRHEVDEPIWFNFTVHNAAYWKGECIGLSPNPRGTTTAATHSRSATHSMNAIQSIAPRHNKQHNLHSNIYLLASKISLHANCSHRRRGTIKINIYLGHTFYFKWNAALNCSTQVMKTSTHTRLVRCVMRMRFASTVLAPLQAVTEANPNVFPIWIK